MRRVHVPPDQLQRGEIELDTSEGRYVRRVLRLHEGAAIELFDGAGRCASAVLTAVRRREVRCLADDPQAVPSSSRPPLRCGLPLIKGERLDIAVRMLTELGTDTITLIRCERAIVQGDRASRMTRLGRVAQAAARQCRRDRVPTLEGPISLGSFAETANGLKLFGDLGTEESTGGGGAPLPDRPPNAITTFTGPEGGLSPQERELLTSHGFRPVLLGPHVLRAETAAVVAAAIARARLPVPSTEGGGSLE